MISDDFGNGNGMGYGADIVLPSSGAPQGIHQMHFVNPTMCSSPHLMGDFPSHLSPLIPPNVYNNTITRINSAMISPQSVHILSALVPLPWIAFPIMMVVVIAVGPSNLGSAVWAVFPILIVTAFVLMMIYMRVLQNSMLIRIQLVRNIINEENMNIYSKLSPSPLLLSVESNVIISAGRRRLRTSTEFYILIRHANGVGPLTIMIANPQMQQMGMQMGSQMAMPVANAPPPAYVDYSNQNQSRNSHANNPQMPIVVGMNTNYQSTQEDNGEKQSAPIPTMVVTSNTQSDGYQRFN